MSRLPGGDGGGNSLPNSLRHRSRDFESARRAQQGAEADLRKRADAVWSRLKELAAELSSKFPQFAAVANPEPRSIAEVRKGAPAARGALRHCPHTRAATDFIDSGWAIQRQF